MRGSETKAQTGALGDFAKKVLINVLVAIVIPVLSGFVGNITPIDQVFLGAFVFIIGLLVQIAFELMSSRQERAPVLELWDIQGEADKSLTNIRASFSKIAAARNSLYMSYFDRQLT